MVSKNVALSILVVGSVFSVLMYIAENNLEAALTIFYLTIYLLVLLRLIEEWRWFRSHNAAPASALFVGTLTFLAIGSSFLADRASLEPIFNISRTLIDIRISLPFIELDTLTLYLNLFSIVFALPFVILLLLLLRNYFTGRYPIIFTFRRRFRKEFPIAYSGLLSGVIIVFWINTGVIEISSLLFVLGICWFFTETYIIKIVSVSVGYILPSSTSSDTQSARTRRSSSSSRSRTSSARSGTSSNSTRLSRDSTTRTRSSRTRSSTTQRRRIPQPSGNVRVVPAIDTTRRRKRSTVKLNKKVLARVMPRGKNINEDDFRCIFCYEFPITTKVVICPYCRHPAHEYEFERWHEVSNLCSRCNNELTSKNIIRISGADYSKIIKMFRSKRI